MTRFALPLALGAVWLLAGCGRDTTQTAEQAAPVPGAGQDIGLPALWSVEALDAQGAVTTTSVVCTDAMIRAAFARSLPSPAGRPCTLIGQPVITVGAFSARCQTDGAEFTVHSDAQGDLKRDFNVQTAITSEADNRQYQQTSRFRLVGACPAGWAVGDSAAPGQTQVVNVLSRATRTADAPAPTPPPG